MGLTRREMLTLALGAPLAAACRTVAPARLPEGNLVGASHEVGHRLRDYEVVQPPSDAWRTIPTVIVGAGVAGLSAAWQLTRAGLEPGRDFIVLDLEPVAGGTARSGDRGAVPHPWGAHYLPAPMADNRPLCRLLEDMGVVETIDDAGHPVIHEQFLCHDPQERLFYGGRWYEGLYLRAGATPEDLAQRARFNARMSEWAAWRDGQGRPAFTLPVRACSNDPHVTALDRMSAATWMDAEGFTSPRLRWMVDYACRDDYGTNAAGTSAWSAVFYFTARMQADGQTRPVITWPEGNGKLAAYLATQSQGAVETDTLAYDIVPRGDGVDVVTLQARDGTARGIHAEHVIFAAPQFIARHVLRPYREAPPPHTTAFEHSAWVVANLHMRARPRERAFPLAWDNVLYDSPSLGYVVATHQQDRGRGPTVFTYYYAITDQAPRDARAQLLQMTQPQWADAVLTDLRRAHPDLPGLVDRLDVMRWGHAMVCPRPGFMWGADRTDAAKSKGRVHFAHTELSGIALFEEAFDHGVRAADTTLAALGRTAAPW